MFRFTIREVLWLTVVVALAVGWWIDRDRLSRTLNKVHHDYFATVAHLEELKMRMDRDDWAFRKAQSEYQRRSDGWLCVALANHGRAARHAKSLALTVARGTGQRRHGPTVSISPHSGRVAVGRASEPRHSSA